MLGFVRPNLSVNVVVIIHPPICYTCLIRGSGRGGAMCLLWTFICLYMLEGSITYISVYFFGNTLYASTVISTCHHYFR